MDIKTNRLIAFIAGHWGIILLMLAAVATNIIWIIRDTSPALWDMAGHSQRSLYFAQLIQGGHFKTIFVFDTIYPPLSYLVTAVMFLIVGFKADVPQFSLLIWLVVFLASIYSLSLCFYKKRSVAVLSAAIALFYPLLLHFTRIYDLDFQLTALVTAAIAALVRSDCFSRRSWAVTFGVLVGLAILTKWTAIIFLSAPVIYIFYRSWGREPMTKEVWKNILFAGVILFIIAAPWYIYHAQTIIDSSVATRNNVFSVPHEDLLSWGNISFYGWWMWRGMAWPLTVVFLIGVVVAIFRRNEGDKIMLWWFIVPYLIMTFLIYSKESRYFLPVMPALAIITAAFFVNLKKGYKIFGIMLVLIMGLFFWADTSWNAKFVSESSQSKMGLAKTYGYLDVKPDSPYFGFTYPTNYHASVKDIINKLAEDFAKNGSGQEVVRIAVVPNSVFLSAQPIQYYARLINFDNPDNKYSVDYSISSQVRGNAWREVIVKADYLITKTGDQGPEVWGPSLYEIAQAESRTDSLFNMNFSLIKTWPLEGIEGQMQEARLYRRKGSVFTE